MKKYIMAGILGVLFPVLMGCESLSGSVNRRPQSAGFRVCTKCLLNEIDKDIKNLVGTVQTAYPGNYRKKNLSPEKYFWYSKYVVRCYCGRGYRYYPSGCGRRRDGC